MIDTIFLAYLFGFIMGLVAAVLIKIVWSLIGALIGARQVRKNTIHVIQKCSKVRLDPDFFNRLEKNRKGRSK